MLHWKIDIFVGLFFLAISGVFGGIASCYPHLAAMFPQFISLALAILSGSLAWMAFRRRNSEEDTHGIKQNISTVLLIVCGLIAYIIVLKWLGYILSTILLIMYTIIVLGYTKIKQVLLISIIAVLIIYVIFRYLINVPLPQGFMGF